MEKKLAALFDYQRFEPNSRLAKMIANTEAKYSRALDDDELDMVNAAGEAEQMDQDILRKHSKKEKSDN